MAEKEGETMKVVESFRQSAEIEDKNNHVKVWLELSALNVKKEIAEKIIGEVEKTKEHITKILAE